MNKIAKLIAVLVVFFIFSIQLLFFESYQTLFPTSDENQNNDFDDSEEEQSADEEDEPGYGKEQIQSKTSESYKPGYGKEQIQSKTSESFKPQNNIIENEILKSNNNSQKQFSPSPPLNALNAPGKSSINLNALDQNQLIDMISLKISQAHNVEKNKITQALIDETEKTKSKGGDVMKTLRQIATIIIKNPSDPLADKIIGIANNNSQKQFSPSPSPSPPLNALNAPGKSSINLNALDQNQLIDMISLKISQAHNVEKNKITQALIDETEKTKSKGGDVMKTLRQIATIIIKNPSDPLADKIIGIAKTK